MESVHKLGKLIEEVSTLFTSIDIPSQINSLISENNKLKEEMKELIETHQNKCDELTQIKTKYDKEIGVKNKEIKEQKEELVRLTKISLIQQYDKQLKDNNDYIKILESQLEKYKNLSKPHSPKIEPIVQVELANNKNSKIELDIVTETHVEKPIEQTEQIELTKTTIVNEKKKKGKKSKSEIVEPVEEIIQEHVEEIIQEPVEEIIQEHVEEIIQEPVGEIIQEPVGEIIQEPVGEIIQEPVGEKTIEPNENEGVSKKKKKQKSKVQEEPVVENLESEKPNKKNGKKAQQEEDEFDPENFEDVNGYELIVYKGGYYLRDLETNELYNIKNNGPNQVVGLINSKGRVKFN
jgi:hypothetical protein